MIRGGVALHCQSDLTFSFFPSAVGVESAWFMVHGCRFLPATSVEPAQHISRFIRNHHIDSSIISIIFWMGDFNAPGIHCPSLTASGREPGIGRELIEFSLSFDLVQLVIDATSQDSLLDIIFVNSNTAEGEFLCEPTGGICDHKALILTLSYTVLGTLYSFTTFPVLIALTIQQFWTPLLKLVQVRIHEQ